MRAPSVVAAQPVETVFVGELLPVTRTEAAPTLAVRVLDSPGHRLISLSDHCTGSTGLPAASSAWASMNRAGLVPLFVIVTEVVPEPEVALTVSGTWAMVSRPLRLA